VGDAAEQCTGISAACPRDAKSAAVCRPSAGVCDLPESCNGTSNDCPADAKRNDVCRPAAGLCDAAETCNGNSNDCPPDMFLPQGTTCRAAPGASDAAAQSPAPTP